MCLVGVLDQNKDRQLKVKVVVCACMHDAVTVWRVHTYIGKLTLCFADRCIRMTALLEYIDLQAGSTQYAHCLCYP